MFSQLPCGSCAPALCTTCCWRLPDLLWLRASLCLPTNGQQFLSSSEGPATEFWLRHGHLLQHVATGGLITHRQHKLSPCIELICNSAMSLTEQATSEA